jgi:DnaJ-class molecular chaperone
MDQNEEEEKDKLDDCEILIKEPQSLKSESQNGSDVPQTIECYKCEGTKLNKNKTKPCRKCKGRGFFKYDFSGDLQSMITIEVSRIV